MPSRFSAQSGKGVLFVALALVATLLVPSMVTWAVKSGAAKPGLEPSGDLDKKDLDKAALMTILTEPKNALVKQYQKLFEMEDVALEFDDEALQTIARDGSSSAAGCASLFPSPCQA